MYVCLSRLGTLIYVHCACVLVLPARLALCVHARGIIAYTYIFLMYFLYTIHGSLVYFTVSTGAHLNYYFGDAVSHIMRYKCKIYFVCDKNNTITGPDFEHMKDNYDVHIHINTKYAC